MKRVMHLESDGKGGFVVYEERNGCLVWIFRIIVLAALIYAMDKGYIKDGPVEKSQTYQFVDVSKQSDDIIDGGIISGVSVTSNN